MKTLTFHLPLIVYAVSAPAFARANGEICKDSNRDAQGITLVWNSDRDTVTVNAQGQQLVYKVEVGTGGSDVSEAYVSRDNGGLKVTFYDQDTSASGWAHDLGAFKLQCNDL